MRRRLVAIFLKVANLFISRLRAGKRLTKIKNWIANNGIRSRADMVKKVAGYANDITIQEFHGKRAVLLALRHVCRNRYCYSNGGARVCRAKPQAITDVATASAALVCE